MAQGSGDEFIPDDTPRSPKEEGPKKKARRASSTGTAKKSKQRRNCKYGERTLTRKALAEMAVYGPPKQYDIPYFAHQQLDPNCYPFCEYRKPVQCCSSSFFTESNTWWPPGMMMC